MKTLSALFVVLALNFSSAAIAAAPAPDPELMKMCDQDGGRELCLVALSTLRCHQLSFPLLPVGDQCSSHTNTLARVLDLKSHPIELEESDGTRATHSLTVIYTQRLRELIREPATQEFIRALMTDLRRAGRDLEEFNLWEHSVKLSGGSEFKALERIAVLLQDTSRTRIQIFFLRDLEKKNQLTPPETEALGNLQVLQELIRDDRFREAGIPAWLTLYPRVRSLNRDLNASPYHFYTMAYAAALMKRARVPDAFAYFLPFLFNTEYEFRELDPKAWPLRIPGPFVIESRLKWKLQDIYAGHTGALFGAGRVSSAVEFQSFVTRLAGNPSGMMSRQLFLLLF